MTREKNKLLFAYGSLLDPDLQMQLFGRHILSEGPAVLEQWEVVSSEEYPYIRPNAQSRVHGEVLKMSPAQLKLADQWEEVPDEYQRETLTVLLNGKEKVRAFAYTRREG